MPKDKFQLREDDLLTRYNYDSWFIKLYTALKARNLLKYIDSDILKTLNQKLLQMKNEDADEGAIKKFKRKIRHAEKRDAQTKTIIHDNITKGPFEYIKRETTAYSTIKKLESLYRRHKTFSVQCWMDKLNSLRANNIDECSNVMNQIMEIFRIMEYNKHSLGDQEKLAIIYNSLPEEIKMTTTPSIDDPPNEFYEKVTKIITFKLYINGKNMNTENINNTNNQNSSSMNISNSNNEIQANYVTRSKRTKYISPPHCEICEKRWTLH